MNNTPTHAESFERFAAQPVGRAKLYLLDYAQTKTAQPRAAPTYGLLFCSL